MTITYPDQALIAAALAGLCREDAASRSVVLALDRGALPAYALPVWDAAQALTASHAPLAYASIRDAVASAGALHGRTAEVVHALTDYVSAQAVAHAAAVIADRHRRHQVTQIIAAASAAVADPAQDLTHVVDSAVQRVSQVVRAAGEVGPVDLRAAARRLLEHMTRPRGKHTGAIPALSDLIGDYMPGDLYVIAARPGVGKTAFALGEAVALAQRGVPVYVHSLEMSVAMIEARLLGITAGLSVSGLVRGDRSMLEVMAEAAGDLSRLPIRIDDTSGVTVEAVCRQARMMHERGQCGCVVVDYLQLLAGSGGSGAQRHEDVAHMSRQLKALSKDLAIPVIAVSQLNRASEQRKGGEPMLSDLRESGQIEQDAAVIMFPHRPSIHDDRMPKHQAFVIVAKNRYGDTGRVEVEWQGKESRFVPLGERLANPPPPTHGGDYGNFRRPSAPPRPPPMPGPPLMPGSPPMPTPDYD